MTPLSLGRRFASKPDASAEGAGNSFISLGAFETMGSDAGRAATGIAYFQETLALTEAEYEKEVIPAKKAARAVTCAQSHLKLGRQYHQQQEFVDAITHYTKALQMAEESLAVYVQVNNMKAINYTRFMITEVLCALGVAHGDAGDGQEALTQLKRALELRKETVGKRHASVAECLNNLGALYFSRKALERAMERYEQALELLIEANGGKEEGPYVAMTVYNIATCRMGLGQTAAAVPALKRSLGIAERALGPDHRQVELIRETMKQVMTPPKPPE